jgi:PASTA domain
MAGLASFLPRFVALPLVALLGTATLTFAADKQLATPESPAQPAAASVPAVLVVPDVRRQAFVFAKGTLEDAGFAWKVTGSVQGYAANPVADQFPAPGTRVVDTGSPVVQVRLAANGRYRQQGSPENTSPYDGSTLKVAGAAAAPAAAAPQPEAAPAPAPAVKPKPAAKPKPKAAAKKATRPPAFAVPGARKEPLDEMPLPDRARALGTYVASHQPTAAAVNHFLYQHSWIVTGAEFGWWRGSQALELLIAVDRRAQKAWGYGAKSEAVARASLARVQKRSR